MGLLFITQSNLALKSDKMLHATILICVLSKELPL
ncbi:MAG: hypothetical protein ACJA17_000487 [Polaribacter sp.]|jgi:hypothetical protein